MCLWKRDTCGKNRGILTNQDYGSKTEPRGMCRSPLQTPQSSGGTMAVITTCSSALRWRSLQSPSRRGSIPRRRFDSAFTLRPSSVNRLTSACIRDLSLTRKQAIPDANRRFRSSHRGLQSIKLAQVRVRGFRARGDKVLSIFAAIRHIIKYFPVFWCSNSVPT